MIRFLSIQRLAIIESLELEFGPGLTILTGETGAGKSILIEAVALLLGARATPALVRTGEASAVVQAIFDTPDGREVIVRRDISAQGRGRAFVDAALTSSAALRDITTLLVDLHGQHDHQTLLDPETHLDLVDAFGGLSPLRDSVGEAYRVYKAAAQEIAATRLSEGEKAARMDLLTFQLAELDRAAPRAREDEELETALRLLANAERLQRLCSEGYVTLYEGDEAVLASLGRVWRQVADLATLDPSFAQFLETRDVIKSQLEDLAYFLRSYGSEIDASPVRLQETADRLALLERLKKKHGGSLERVLERQAAMRAELSNLELSEERLRDLQEALGAATSGYLEAAAELSRRRRTAARALARDLERELRDLAMERTRCEIRFADDRDEPHWTARGIDRAELAISPNPGEELRPLATIASGGELSRVMLALKTLASTDAPGKTLIFDEVDAGIGGRVADVVGRKLRSLSREFQVLCITHLPQIAAYGDTHFRVEKALRQKRTVTTVTPLDRGERVEELARMLGGAEVSERVRASAREMLETRGASEEKTKGESETAKAKGVRRG